MEFLELDKQGPQIQDPLGEGQQTNVVPANASLIMAEYYQHVLSRPAEEVEQEINRGMHELLRNQANGVSDERKALRLEDELAAAIEREEDPQTFLEEIRTTTQFGQYLAPEVSVLLEGGEVADRELRLLDRVIRAEEIIASQSEASSKGFWGAVGYFGDIAVSDVGHSIVGGLGNLVGAGEDTFEEASQRRELAKQLNDLLLSDVSTETFETEFTQIIGRISDAGFFSESNPFYLQEFLMMVQEGGEGRISQAATAFQVLDLATAGIGTAVTKGAMRLGSLPRTVGKLRGNQAAVQSALRLSDRGVAEVVAEVEPSLTRMANEDSIHMSAPDLEIMRNLEARNAALNIILKGERATLTDPEVLTARMNDLIEQIRTQHGATTKREIDVNVISDAQDNLIGRVTLGRVTDGLPYASRAAAQREANRVGGEVIETVHEGSKQFVIAKDYNLSSAGLAKTTDVGEISTGFLTSISSTTRRTTSYLDGVLKWGESVNARNMKTVGRLLKAARSQASRQDIADVNAIFRELRDDPNFSWRREPYTRAEFIERYTNKFNGRPPSEQATQYWETIQQISDADYFLNADRILKEAVENGETMVRLDGDYFRAKPVTPVNGTKVWDMDLGKLRPKTTDDVVYHVKDFAYKPEGISGAIEFVTGRNLVRRRLFHTDVMEYNVGGHRAYTQDMNFFLKQEGSIVLADGTEAAVKPNAFMGTRTEAEARAAVTAWNKVADRMADDLMMNNVTDDFIEETLGEAFGISDRTQFLKFADEQGINPAKRVDFAPEGSALRGQGLSESMWAGEATVASVFRNSFTNRARGRKPLEGYGGGMLETLDPSQAMERGFVNSLNRAQHRQYLNRATKGLLRTIEKLEEAGEGHVKNWRDLKGMSTEQIVRNLEFEATEIGRKLAQEQQTILRVLDRKDPDLLHTQRMLNAAAEWTYGKRGTIENMVGKQNAKRFQAGVDVFAKLDYPGFIRSVAFHTKLGFLAPDQLLVQGSQVINAVGISSATLGTTGAVRAASGGAWLMRAASASDEAALEIARRQSSVTGISPEDFMDLRTWWNRSGRGIVDRTAIEENRDAMLGGNVKATLSNVSTTFFRTGEVFARAAAATINVAEIRSRGFKGSFLTETMSTKMFQRQDILTASMTAASAAPWQKGLLAIPLQFLTYNVRIMEQILTPDVLTKAERARLATTHLFLYGGAAVPGVGYLMDKYNYEGVYHEDLFHGTRYGALDFALSQLAELAGGSKTALSTRIGVGDGLFQLGGDVGSESFAEILVGPGGQIIWDSLSATGKIIDGLFSQSYDATAYDLNRFARIVGSYDDAYKLWAAATYGEYWTRNTGTVTMNDLNVTDGLLQAMGVPLAGQDQLWATINFESKRKEHYEKTLSTIEELSRLAARKFGDRDDEAGAAVMDDIQFLLQGLPASQREEALRRLRRNQDLPDVIEQRLIRDGRADIAERLRRIQE